MKTIKKRNKKYFYKRYFFDNPSTLLLPFFFVALASIVFLQQIPEYSIKQIFFKEGILTGLNSLVGGLYAFGLTFVMVVLYGFIKNRINKAITPDPINDVKPFVIDDYKDGLGREKGFRELSKFLENDKNIYGFVVGNSGSGKSTLLGEFMKRHKRFFADNPEHDIRVEIFNSDDYAVARKLESKLTQTKESCEKLKKNVQYIVIFDQFERTLNVEGVFDEIEKFLENTYNTNIIPYFVSTRNRYLDALECIQKLKCANNIPIGKFEIGTSEDVEDMVKEFRGELGGAGSETVTLDNKRIQYFKELLKNAPMIEVNIARVYFGASRIYAESKEEDKENGWEITLKHEFPIEQILGKYFNKLFSGIEDSYLAMVALYAICCTDYSNILTVKDFQNLTFLPAEKIYKEEEESTAMLNILMDKRIIRCINKKAENPQFIMTHDYLIDYLEDYCRGKLHEQVTTNIRCYCKEKMKRQKRNQESKSELSPYYESAIEKPTTSSKFLSVCLIALCIAMTAVCFWYEVTGYGVTQFSIFGTEINHNLLALNVIGCGSAVFYIYHYLYHFAKIFFSEGFKSVAFWLCGTLVFIGMSLIVLALLVYEISVIFIGCGWFIVALIHLNLSRKPLPNAIEKTRLKREGSLYVIITFILIGLNAIVILFGGITEFHYMMFSILVIMIIRQQIHNDFMLSKIGVFVSMVNTKSKARKVQIND